MTEIQVGYYGKIPSKGDFISRQLPRGFIDTWDQWLQECIVTSRRQLNSSWLDNYLISPIWRFAVSSGICNESAWIGILMPSVDQVGRYFPLTVALPIMSYLSPLDLIHDEQHWFVNAELVAQSALNQEIELPDLDAKIDTLGLPEIFSKPYYKESKSKIFFYENYWHMELADTQSLAPYINEICRYTLKQHFNRLCFWWTQGSERVKPSLIITDGLLPAYQYSSFLNGAWA